MKKKLLRPPFVCALNKTEFTLALCFLPVYVIVMPILIGMLKEYWPTPLPSIKVSTVYCLIGFLFVLLCQRKALRADWDRLCDHKLATFLTLVGAHVLNVLLSMVIVLVSIALFNDSSNLYETESVKSSGGQMFTALVLLSPVVEEMLFRGALFGLIRKKNRIAAYIVSILLYAIAGVWQLSGATAGEYIFYALQAMPAAFALAWCYERSGCIWAPILYHALLNISAGVTM